MEYPATSASVEVLPNGLTLILDEDHTAPVISAQIWVETGSIHEDRLLGAGLSHFLEHMVFKGTRDYDGDALADAVQAAGGHWNAYTTFDRTVYYIDGPAHSLDELLKCLTGLVFFPTLPVSEFENEKDVIRREIDMGLDDPDHASMRLMLATAYQRDPRRQPVIGHRHLFDAIEHRDLLAYHRQRYTPERCFVALSGDFDVEHARARILALTAELKPGGGPEPLISIDPPQQGPRQARATFPIATSRLSLVWHCPPLHHPDTPAYEVLATLLGSGRSARLYRELREEQGLALEISAFAWNFPGLNGLFGIGAECLPDRQQALVEAIHHILSSLDTDQLGSDLAKAKRQIAASQFKTLATASGRASDLASNWHEARDLDFTRCHLQAVEEVTAADVLRVAAALRPQHCSQTVLDPLEAPAPASRRKSSRKQEEIRVEKLPNGIPVALIPDRRVPLVHLQATARAGLPSENPQTQGINQLLAATLPKGAVGRDALQIALELESLGASASASTGNNALLVQATGLAPDFRTISGVFADLIGQATLPEEAIEREKASQLAALRDSLQEPLHVAMRALRATAFQSAGYGLDALGSEESLAALDRAALVRHQQRHLNAANLALAIAGDFDPPAVMDQLAASFSYLDEGKRWSPPASVFRAGQQVTRHLPKKQAVLAVGFQGGSASSEDRHALAFLQEYASDMAGPLFGRIREELGLAYQVGATQFLGYDSGLFTFYLATAPEQLELAHNELLAEIGRIATAGIPADAFERVRATALSGLAIQQQSLAAAARHCALDLIFGHPADLHRQLPLIYQDLDAGQVAQVAARIFSAPPVIATVLPES